jgi:chromate transporter
VAGVTQADTPFPAPATLRELFLTFTGLAVRGFGGVLPWAQRVLVEEKNWLSNQDFAEMLSLAQILPGPNVCNLSLMVGHRYFGLRGAFVALAGMIAAPLVIVLLMATFYHQYAHLAVAQNIIKGMGAVSAGMLISMAMKVGRSQLSWRHGRWAWVWCVLSFVAVGLMRWPLFWVLLVLAPLALLTAGKDTQA